MKIVDIAEVTAPMLLPTPSLARVFDVKSAGYANIEPLPR
jgi:hypothetical protein